MTARKFIREVGQFSKYGTLTFASRADAAVANLSEFDTVTVEKWSSTSVICPASYKKVSSEPSHLAKFQDASGNWWELNESYPDIRMFGAIGDGVALDTDAVLAGWTMVDTLDLGEGTFKLGLLESVFGKSLRGAGTSATTILVDGPSFWKITNSGVTFAVSRLGNLSVIATQPPTEGSFGVWADGGSSANRQSFILDDHVAFRSSDNLPVGANGFMDYIRLSNLQSPIVRDPMIKGTFNTQSSGGVGTQAQTTALRIDGQTIDPFVWGMQGGGVYNGILLTDSVEGYFIYSPALVGVYNGIYNDTTPAGTVRPGAWIVNPHINAVRRGIYIQNKVDVNITAPVIYRSDVFFDSDFDGLYLVSCSRGSIVNPQVVTQLDAGIRNLICIENCTAITGTTPTLSGQPSTGTVNGIIHVGVNSDIIWNGVVFNGVTNGFTLSASDTDINIGPHEFLGSVTTKYVIPTKKQSIRVYRKDPSYSRVGSYSPAAVGATETKTVGVSPQLNFYNFGSGTYTYNLDLVTTDAMEGDYFDFKIITPSNANAVVQIRNGSAGPVLVSLSTATSTRYAIRAAMNNSGAWIISSAVVMLTV